MPMPQPEVTITLDGVSLPALLSVPADPQGVVLFAHGSSSSRLSPRNNDVAQGLHQAGLATLLMDLLTEQEDTDYSQRFNIELLVERLIGTTDWLKTQGGVADLPIGYFGASTGAAAALGAAAKRSGAISAVVSRGGRLDLAPDLGKVVAPTLLIVGGDDHEVIELNKQALQKLTCVTEMTLVPGATHLFEEPGALEQVTKLSMEWFSRYLN